MKKYKVTFRVFETKEQIEREFLSHSSWPLDVFMAATDAMIGFCSAHEYKYADLDLVKVEHES